MALFCISVLLEWIQLTKEFVVVNDGLTIEFIHNAVKIQTP